MGKGRSGGKRRQLARKQAVSSRAATKKNRTSDLFSRAKLHDFSSRSTFNKFDIRDNKKQKHVVLGRKVKGRSRDVSRARAVRQAELEESLRPAMSASGKANSFVDRRIGENDNSMDQEERDLQRFIRAQKDRFRTAGKKRGSMFNLGGEDAEDGEADVLTHGGKSVNEIDFGQHKGEEGFDSGDDMLNSDVVERLHFGGGSEGNMLGGGRGDSSSAPKTRDEIYRELIAKSKAYKAERQRQKREDEEEQDRLDEELDELRGLLNFREKKPSKKDEMQEMMKRAGLLTGEDAKSSKKVTKLTQKQKRQGLSADMDDDDDFDAVAKSLLFEARAQASDRTKTPEERAMEERERLEELERERLRRARGDFDDEDADMDEDIDGSGAVSRGDGLGMNFRLDPEFLGQGMSSGAENSDYEDAQLVGQDGQTISQDEADAKRTTSEKTEVVEGASSLSENVVEDMPYVLPCPSNVASFIELVGRYALPSEKPHLVETLLERINACHSVHLPCKTPGTTNRDKIGRLFAIVLHYLVSMGATSNSNALIAPFPRVGHIQAVVNSLYNLASDVPLAAGEAFRAALHRIFLQCVEGAHPEDETDRSHSRRRWPTVGELMLLRTTFLIFPVTDYRHPVATPFAILLGALLASGNHHSGCGPVRTAKDLTKALFLAELQLDVAKKSKRIAPESINFICGAIARLILDTLSVGNGKGGKVVDVVGEKGQAERKMRLAQVRKAALKLVSKAPVFARTDNQMVDFMALRKMTMSEEKKYAKQKKKTVNGKTAECKEDDRIDTYADYMPSKLFEMKSLLSISSSASSNEDRKDEGKKKKKEENSFQCSYVLKSLFALLERAAEQFNSNVALPEMFADGLACLKFLLNQDGRFEFPASIEQRAEHAVKKVTESVETSLEMRVPCRMQAQVRRAVPIRQQRPMFDENYVVRKDNDPDKERAELKSLKRKIKREQKAVARDLRRDALFVAQEQEKRDRAWEKETLSKYNKVVEFVNQQHAEAKAVQREGVAHGGGMVAGRRFKRARHAK